MRLPLRGCIIGKKKSKSKTKSEPWKPLQPAILGAANQLSGIVSGNQGHLDSIAGDIRGFLPQLGQMAFGSNPALTSGMNYANDVLSGKYLGQGNPYLEQMTAKARENAGNQINSTFSMAGRTGGGNHYERAGEGIANAENALRYQDYDAERNRMGQQSGLLPGLIQSQYAGVPAYLAAAQTAGQLPYAGASALSPLLGLAAGSGTSTTKQSNGGGLLGGLLGSTLASLPSYFGG